MILAALVLATFGAAFAPRHNLLAIFGGLWALAVLLTTPDMGTCTQGDAGQLFLAVFALPGLVACLSIAVRTDTPRRLAPRRLALGLLPLTPLALWAGWFAIRLTWALVTQHQTACGFLQDTGHVPDGKEIFYASLWFLTALLFPMATAVTLALRRNRRAVPFIFS